MTARFIQDGKSIDYTPSAAVVAGDVVVQGELVGVAQQDIAADQLGALAIEGVFEFPKPTGAGTDAAVGTLMYWDVADGNAQETADTGTNKLIGKLVKACSTTDTVCLIKLDQ